MLYNYAQDEFVDDPEMPAHLAKMGVKTLERASHELPLWHKAEEESATVRVAIGDTVRAISKFNGCLKNMRGLFLNSCAFIFHI